MPAPIPNSKGNPFSGGVKYTGMGKLIFDGNCRLSRKQYEADGYYATLVGSRECRIE